MPQTPMPLPSLDLYRSMGNPLLYQPPPQDGLVEGAISHVGVPFAIEPGYRPMRLDLHLPKDATEPVPLVVYGSGGAWRIVGKHFGPWPILPRNGYAVAVIEYRLSGEARYPAPVHDVKAAVRFLRANASEYGVDPTRIGGWGSSAGGYLIALAALTNGNPDFEGSVGGNLDQSSDLKAVIDHYGATDLQGMAEDTNGVPGVVEDFGTDTSPETLLLGFRPDSDPDAARAASPVSYARADVPFLIMHGDADTRLGFNQSVRLHDAIKAAGGEVAFHTVPGANHGTPEFLADDANRLALDFLDRHLR